MKKTSHTRPRPVLFVHGGGSEDDYAADARLVASLQEALGESHAVQYPFLPQEPEPDLGRKKQIGRALSLTGGKVILAGHSLGASMLLKYLSESRSRKQVAGLFLLAAPFWSGDEDWKQGFVLPEGFADKLPDKVPVFLYHCQDDEEVPVAHLEVYAPTQPFANCPAAATSSITTFPWLPGTCNPCGTYRGKITFPCQPKTAACWGVSICSLPLPRTTAGIP